MKTKTQPLRIKSGNYLEQALFKGLNKKQKEYAKMQVKKCEESGIEVHYGIIRKLAMQVN
jgi:phage-related protein